MRDVRFLVCLHDAYNAIPENPVGSGDSAGFIACSNTEMLRAVSTQMLESAFVSQDTISAMQYPELVCFANHKNTDFEAAAAAAAEVKKAVLKTLPMYSSGTGITMTVTRVAGKDGVYSATMEAPSGNIANAQLYAAYYNVNQMLSVIQAVADDPAFVSLKFSAPAEGQNLRFYFWSDTLEPYIQPIVWN